ncbi:MAG: hypothetical protein JRI84_16090 [Deltaproteobacteria bacterium]|nr:hypothetical protein [Deltaproteobacteria bacterium]
MGRLIQVKVKGAITSQIVAVFIALAVAVILWFFIHVVFGVGALPFLVFWKWSYILIGIVFFIADLSRTILLIWMVKGLSQRYEAPTADVVEYILDHDLLEEEGFQEWDPAAFKKNLELKRTCTSLAAAIVKSLR